MAKAIIVIGPGKDMLRRAALQTRDKLIECTKLTTDDIHLIDGSLDEHDSTLDKLTGRLNLQSENEALMLIYIGFGNTQGWQFEDQGQVLTIPYTNLAELLFKYEFPLQFVNACYYSTAAIPAFKKLLTKKRHFGMITPYGETEGGWEGYFLNVKLMMFLDLHMPYDHGVWNEHWHELTFGFFPKKPSFIWDQKKKCMRFAVNGKVSTQDQTSTGIPARHGKVLDHHFWTFSYNSLKEYTTQIEKYLKKKLKAKNKRKAERLKSSSGEGYIILEHR